MKTFTELKHDLEDIIELLDTFRENIATAEATSLTYGRFLNDAHRAAIEGAKGLDRCHNRFEDYEVEVLDQPSFFIGDAVKEALRMTG